LTLNNLVLPTSIDRSSSELDWEFVDWKGFDYLIINKNIYDWIAGIQCKTGFVGGFLDYHKELEKLKDFASNFAIKKTLIMVCGGVTPSKKEEVRKAFENEGWRFYYLWADLNSDQIDQSFYEFIDTIEQIGHDTATPDVT